MPVLSRIKNRLLMESHWRCREPVVVIESDDWGLDRKPCSELLAGRGEATDWALEATETVDDLNQLYQVLRRHRDSYGRPACVTANFVLSNPNYEAIAASRFEEYVHTDLDLSCPEERRLKYMEGLSEGCFFPQHHGLRHLCAEALLRDLRNGEAGARELFDFRAAAGLSMVKGSLWRYHSEYQDWGQSRVDSPEVLQHTIDTGVGIFERLFGFLPQSTISPHYLVSDSLFPAWKQAGLRFVQGGNYQVRGATGQAQRVRSDGLGANAPDGLLFLSRNVKLEDRPGRRETAASALDAAQWCFEANVPVVVDSHRINYTGGFRQRGLDALETFLVGVRPMKPLFMTSAELGGAIADGGRFPDQRSGESRTLTPVGAWRNSAARMMMASL